MEPTARLIDLSWPFFPGMATFPGDPPMELRRMGDYATDGFRSHLASLPAHSGTHVDAPGHVLPGAAMLADLPLSRFAGPGALLDLRGRAELAVTAQDLAPHLPRLADLPPAFVLLWTGDEARWGTPGYYAAGAHLSEEAATLLAGLPGLSGIGIDAGSADAAGSFALPAHRALLGAGLVIVENLRGLADLPPTGFEFFCLPVLGLDGSPVRAAASVPGARA
ncbi:MAG: cyclase family protein [Desulfovibrio sp.]